ncbi:MAG: AtpZ/AtpI family protein [Rhizobiales bacterium]|nr:AtpZ/AtpI family protein [Hyphomicrobiales bacterium]
MPDERNGEGVGRGEISPADRAKFKQRVGDLGKQLEEARSQQAENEPARDSAIRARGMAYGLRMASELVGAVLVGGLIGYFLDQALGSWPWLFLVFFLLGFAAGVLNVIRGFTRLQAEIKEATRGDIGHAVPDDEDD